MARELARIRWFEYPGFVRWLLYLAIISLIFGKWNGSFPLDDAYITLHNARSLLEGVDTLYGQSPLVGATSSIHLLLLTCLGQILPFKHASFVLCLASAIAYAAGLDRLVRKEGAENWRRPLLVSTGLTIGTVPLQLPNGLETGLAMAFVAWLLALRDHRAFAILAGLAPFVRPELGVLSALLLLRFAKGRSASEVGLALLIAAATAAPWLTWIYLETCALLPGTASTKVAFFAEAGLPIHTKALLLVGAFGLYLPAMVGLGMGNERWLRTGFVALLVVAAFVVLPGSLTWNHSRYLAPLVPLLLAGFSARNDALLPLLGVFGLITGTWSILQLQHARTSVRMDELQIRQSLKHVPEGATILVHDAGLIAWTNPDAKLVDVVGLKTPSSAESHRRHTRHACRWHAAIDEIARDSRAEFAVVLDRPFWRCIGRNLAEAGWKMEPEGSGRYQFYRIAAPQ